MTDDARVPFEEVQTAVYTLLNGNITGGLYDEVPPGATFPYTTFGEPSDGAFEARGVKGRMVFFPFKIHSRDAGGKYQCFQIMNKIVELMTKAKISMTNWAEVWKTYRLGMVRRLEQEPGEAYEGGIVFMIVVCRK
jgi:hypothetical protein